MDPERDCRALFLLKYAFDSINAVDMPITSHIPADTVIASLIVTVYHYVRQCKDHSGIISIRQRPFISDRVIYTVFHRHLDLDKDCHASLLLSMASHSCRSLRCQLHRRYQSRRCTNPLSTPHVTETVLATEVETITVYKYVRKFTHRFSAHPGWFTLSKRTKRRKFTPFWGYRRC